MTNTTAKIKLTVAISLYNYADFINKSITSICHQTIASSVELIIVNDCSTDNSVDTVNRLQKEFKNLINKLASFKLISHMANLGLAEARNTAFKLASAPYILVLDADNILLAQACEILLAKLQAAPESVGAVYPLMAVYGHPTQFIANELPWDPIRLAKSNFIDAMALVRKTAWLTVGGYSHIKGGWEDYDFWCKFVENNISAVQVPKILAVYQNHTDSMKNSCTINKEAELSKLLISKHPWLKLDYQDKS